MEIKIGGENIEMPEANSVVFSLFLLFRIWKAWDMCLSGPTVEEQLALGLKSEHSFEPKVIKIFCIFYIILQLLE